MSLTETKEIDRIEVVGAGYLQVREATTIMRDGIEVAKTFHRWAFAPGEDISAMPDKVKAIAAVVWTPEIIEQYKQMMAAQIAQKGAQA